MAARQPDGGEIEKIEEIMSILPGEQVVSTAKDVAFIQKDQGLMNHVLGVLSCTNFRLSFQPLSQPVETHEAWLKNHLVKENEISLVAIHSIYKVKGNKKKQLVSGAVFKPHMDIEIVCKNFCCYRYSFKTTSEDSMKNLLEAILRYAFPTKLTLLFAFECKKFFQPGFNNGNGSEQDQPPEGEDADWPSFRDVISWEKEIARLNAAANLRVTLHNQDYRLSESLPEYFVVPKGLDDNALNIASAHFYGNRVPFWCWTGSNGCSMFRMAKFQADSSLHDSERKMFEAIRSSHPKNKSSLIVDLDTLDMSPKEIGQSCRRLRELCVKEQGRDPKTDDKWLLELEDTKWLPFVSKLLKVGISVAKKLEEEGLNIIIRESEGRDVSCIISCLVQILLDGHARTQQGFQSLVQKEWVVAGHQFTDRLQFRYILDSYESPVFLLFLDCVQQLTRILPRAFQFNHLYLVSVWDSAYCGLFETFLFNSEKQRERYRHNVAAPEKSLALPSAWDWSQQFQPDRLHLFANPLYLARSRTLDLSPPADQDGRPTATAATEDRYYSLEDLSSLQAGAGVPGLCLWTECYMRHTTFTAGLGQGLPEELGLQLGLVCQVSELVRTLDHLLLADHGGPKDSGLKVALARWGSAARKFGQPASENPGGQRASPPKGPELPANNFKSYYYNSDGANIT